MKFILNKDILEIENIEVVKSGSVNYYEADVEYDESWNDLIIEAVMLKKDEDAGKSIAVINNKMYIDQRLRGTYCIGFVGYKIEEEKKIYQVSTNLQKVYFDLGAGEIETENVEVPTPTEWEIYNAQIQEFIKQGQTVVDEANNLNVELQDNILTITRKDGTEYSENVKGDAYIITEEDYEQIEGNVKTDIQPILEEIENIANQAETIAKGRATGYVFDTLEDLELWLQDKTNTSKLILGDNLYIRALGVPDYWWDGTTKQVLETEKPDLTPYAKTEQFVTLTQAEYDALEVKSANTYYFIIEEE